MGLPACIGFGISFGYGCKRVGFRTKSWWIRIRLYDFKFGFDFDPEPGSDLEQNNGGTGSDCIVSISDQFQDSKQVTISKKHTSTVKVQLWFQIVNAFTC